MIHLPRKDKTAGENLCDKNNRQNKIMLLDYNLNVLDYNNNTKVKNVFNMMFRHGIISLTIVTKHTATAIDNIFTNKYFNTYLKTVKIKTDASDHFPLFFLQIAILISWRYKNNIILYLHASAYIYLVSRRNHFKIK